MSKLYYKKYLNQIQSSLIKKPKDFSKFVKNRQKTNIILYNITRDDITINNMESTINEFKLFF